MRLISITAGLLILFAASAAHSQSIILDKEETRVFQKFTWVPYGFFSESFGLGLGVGGGYSGWPTDPASVLGAVTIGTKGSYNIAGGLVDYQVPGVPRLVVEPIFVSGLYQDQRVYVGRNPNFPGERAGSNGSHEDNFVEVRQWDNWAELRFHYLFPIGDGDEEIVHKYIVDRGFLIRNPSGGDSWNPFAGGRTRLSVTPGWRGQDLKNNRDEEFPLKTVNLEIALKYDNRDFPFNATRGSSQRIAFQRDFDNDERFGEWEAWTFELNKLFNLGASDRFRQRVLALGFWSSYVPTWETRIENGVEVVTRRPPYYEGAVLGGIYRMRAFEDSRWQDKAAVYYSAEYRMIPNWQPLQSYDWLDFAAIQYWQWVVFAEAGQVAPHYNVGDLHDDLRFDAGFGLRGMLHKAVCRLDISFGEEGSRVVAMYGQPF
jgi:hypothetical protein